MKLSAIRNRAAAAALFFLLLPALAAAEWASPFLWRIDGDQPSYLFGTIHLADPRLAILPAAVDDAFKEAGAVYTEIPFDPQSMGRVVQATIAPSGEGLAAILPEDLHKRAATVLRNIRPELDITAFDGLRVWAFATQLVLLEAQLKNPFGTPLDLRLYRRAASEGKATRALETIDEQLAVFGDLSREEEINMLRDTIEYLEEAQAEDRDIVEEMLALYLAGDLARLGDLLEEAMAGGSDTDLNERLTRKLLTDRDQRMAERIARHIREEPETVHFFAVGAGHFASAEGIQHHLRAKGFAVERVGLVSPDNR